MFPLKIPKITPKQPILNLEHPPIPTKLVDLVIPDSNNEDDVPVIPPAGPQPPPGPPPPAPLAPMPGPAPSPPPVGPPQRPAPGPPPQPPQCSTWIFNQRPVPDSPNISPDKIQRWIPSITAFNNSVKAVGLSMNRCS